MIHCTPTSLFSWNFTLSGPGFEAYAAIPWFTDSGSFTIQGTTYKVEKQGFASGHWKLRRSGRVLAEAHRTHAFRRHVFIRSGKAEVVLEAKGWGSTFIVHRDEHQLARISFDQVLGRRSTIDTEAGALEPHVLVFAFWLTALFWRRASGGGGG